MCFRLSRVSEGQIDFTYMLVGGAVAWVERQGKPVMRERRSQLPQSSRARTTAQELRNPVTLG